jgi:hypothetical protein
VLRNDPRPISLCWPLSRTQIFEKGILQKRTQLRATK